MKSIYPAKFILQDNGYTVDFLDFNCTTEGDTLEEAIEMAKEGMGFYLEDLSNTDIPQPTLSFNKIKLEKNCTKSQNYPKILAFVCNSCYNTK